MALSFAIDTSKGETFDSAKNKRKQADMLAQSILGRAPKNVGEGLNSIGQAMIYRMLMNESGAAERAGEASASDTMGSIFGGFPAAPSAGGSGAVASSDPSVSPNANVGSTIDFARAKSAPVDLSGDQQTFISTLLPAAIEESKRTGVDPRIIVAQAAQETGWGKSAPGNNYFGIKSHGKAGGQNLTTHEVVNGQRVKINDSFRQFGSPAESVRGYGDFLLENPRYKPMMAAQGLDAQLQALGASGYATDPNYAASVGSIARGIPMPAQQPAPAQVASLDPSIGMPNAGPVPSEYSSMGLTPDAWQAMNAPDGAQPAPQPAPSLPAPRMVPGMPIAATQQTAQAVGGQLQGDGQNRPVVGTLGINNRPMLQNQDGSVSTEESITVTDPRLNGGRPTNIPSIWNGQRLREGDAVSAAMQSGQQFPAFGSIDEAVSAARSRSAELGRAVDGQQNAGPDLSRLPVTAGGTAGALQPGQSSGPSLQQLLQAAQNPWLNENQRQVVNMLLEREMQKQDPMRRMQLEKGQLEIDNLRSGTPSASSSFGNMDAQARAAGLAPGTPEYQSFMLNGGGDPATFRALDMQAKAAGFQPGTPKYSEFMATRGAGLSAGAAQTAKNEADIATGGAAAGAVDLGKATIKAGTDAWESYGKIQANLGSLNDAIAAIDGGAQSGLVYKMLPNVTEASASLDNAMNRMGLDVVGSVTFGALSEGELRLAMDTAVPRDLSPPELRNWLVRKRDAQQKAAGMLADAAQYLTVPGNTINGWIARNRAMKEQPAKKSAVINGYTIEQVED